MKIIKIKIMKLRHLLQFRRYNFTFIRMIVNMSNTYYSMVDILYDNNSSICCLKLIRLDAPKDSSSFQYLSRVWDHQNCCTSSFILLIRWYGMQNTNMQYDQKSYVVVAFRETFRRCFFQFQFSLVGETLRARRLYLITY